MKVPTTDEEAKETILGRVGAEYAVWAAVDKLVRQSVRDICGISSRPGINAKDFRFGSDLALDSEVDEVLEDLGNGIIREMEGYASMLEEESGDSGYILYMESERNGKTLEGRMREYLGRFKNELEVSIAAGLLLGKGPVEIASAILSSLLSPYGNPDVRKALGRGLAATRLAMVGKGIGKGQMASAVNALSLLVRTEAGGLWMHAMGQSAIRGGKVGFISFCGSSMPCGYCSSQSGVPQDISAFPVLYHPRCKCYFLFF